MLINTSPVQGIIPHVASGVCWAGGEHTLPLTYEFHVTWVCVKPHHNLCLPKTAWIAVHCRLFLPSQVKNICGSRNIRVKCLRPVSKSQKLFNFWQTLLVKQNLWRKRSAVFYLGMDKQVLKCFSLRKDQVGNTAVCFWCKKPRSASFLSEILLQMWRASRLSLVHLRSHENQLIKKTKLLHDLLHI